ncbi:HNH endonuclease [Rhodococcus sp. 14-2496-1d]|uniref:HNH endonuclease n=1 Tax=Rhodococcus sp. 14-2496-1d TaxID=2023146 RepID=UPI001179F36D|nr:HNH endonuclease [Rhodococcus sp. 14-2496-1d]
MAFWWASQGKNHTTAIRQGSLWTAPRIGGSLPTDRALIKHIAPGDVVFHYDGPYLRAVSVATTASVPCHRPDGYPKDIAAQPDDGWLVRVDPVIEGLAVHFERIAELLPHGSPGPLDKNGTPQQKYLSTLTAQQGALLLEEIDLVLAEIDLDDPSPSGESPSSPVNEETDAAALVWGRIEQRGLRRRLLDGRADAPCGLCGRLLPAALLVAGHIKPRAHCTNQERWDYPNVAMLACLLGCDALFEHGYITVDDSGTIVDGRPTAVDALVNARSALVGSPCPAFSPGRAASFKAHRQLHQT